MLENLPLFLFHDKSSTEKLTENTYLIKQLYSFKYIRCNDIVMKKSKKSPLHPLFCTFNFSVTIIDCSIKKKLECIIITSRRRNYSRRFYEPERLWTGTVKN